MDILEETVRRIAGVHEAIGSSLDGFGGRLRCETCRVGWALEPGMAGSYVARGWPKCCGYTMHWWTQRQIDAGEMPA
jgi:hypothetical protein